MSVLQGWVRADDLGGEPREGGGVAQGQEMVGAVDRDRLGVRQVPRGSGAAAS